MRPAVLIATVLLLSPGASYADLSVAEDGQEITHECKDDAVSITSNRNKVLLTGRCKLVSIDGNDNTVTIAAAAGLAVSGNGNVVATDRADRIYTPGNDNRVQYKGAVAAKKKTKVWNPGNRNRISKVK